MKLTPRQIFEFLQESAPGLRWNYDSRQSEDGFSALITACFVVNHFNGTEVNFPIASLSISHGNDGRRSYSVSFAGAVDTFQSYEVATSWLLAKFRQFAPPSQE